MCMWNTVVSFEFTTILQYNADTVIQIFNSLLYQNFFDIQF